VSKSSVDRLGDRLKNGDPIESDLRELDLYRRSAGTDYDRVITAIREMGYSVTGRPLKSTQSIIDKLRRESCRLTQMQDIAGCRVVVPDIKNQDEAVKALSERLPRASVIDRRKKPNFGYRAVHIIARCETMSVEIQIRTDAQHKWSELSEKLSDLKGIEVKYGGGSEQTRKLLTSSGNLIRDLEANEIQVTSIKDAIDRAVSTIGAATADSTASNQLKTSMEKLRQTSENLNKSILQRRLETLRLIDEYLNNPED